jgi:hypothetical protein
VEQQEVGSRSWNLGWTYRCMMTGADHHHHHHQQQQQQEEVLAP